jgi:hypothetical protein
MLVVGSCVGCRPRREAAAPKRAPLATSTSTAPAPAPAPAQLGFAGPGVRLSYPGGWVAVPSDDFVLRLVPAGAGNDAAAPSVSLDVPKLPPHIPGLIPLGRVVRGYIDDLKEKHRGVTVADPADTTVAGAKARLVRASWDEPDGASYLEVAVLTVHGDRVYIFRGNQPAEANATEIVRPVLEQIIASVRWE